MKYDYFTSFLKTKQQKTISEWFMAGSIRTQGNKGRLEMIYFYKQKQIQIHNITVDISMVVSYSPFHKSLYINIQKK